MDYLNEIQLRVSGQLRGDEFWSCCPFHSESNPSFSVKISGGDPGLFNCFGCGAKGNFFKLIAHLDGLTISEAKEKFGDDFSVEKITGLKKSFFDKLQSQREPESIKVLSLELLDNFCPPAGVYLEYLHSRKISDGTIKRFGVKAATKGIWKNRVVIPVFDEYGRLISLTARHVEKKIDKKNKVRKLKDTDRSKVLYGIHAFADRTNIVLVEGEFDAIYLNQFGVPAVSVGMGRPSNIQIRKLAKYASRVFLSLDGDVPDDRIKDVRDMIAPWVPVTVIRLPEGLDPNDLSETQVKTIFGRIKK